MEPQPGALTLSEYDRRVLAVWAADCAERTLSLFEAQAPSDTRPRDAIDGLRAFARGEMRIGKVRALSARAHAPNDPTAVADEVRWQQSHASLTVRDLLAKLGRLPPPTRPTGMLGALISDMHATVTGGE